MLILNIPSYTNTSTYGTPALQTVGVRPFIDFMEEDLELIIFDDECFAENINYIHANAPSTPQTYDAIIDNAFMSSSVGGELKVSDREMLIRLQESKLLRKPSNDDIVTVRGIKYNVSDDKPDGVGTTILRLERDITIE